MNNAGLMISLNIHKKAFVDHNCSELTTTTTATNLFLNAKVMELLKEYEAKDVEKLEK